MITLTQKLQRFRGVRFYKNQDLRRITEIEECCFAIPWTSREFEEVINQSNTFCKIYVNRQYKLAGYIVYRIENSLCDILSIGVDILQRQVGIGRRLMHNLYKELPVNTRVISHVADYNYNAHKFFSAVGFKANGVVENYFARDHAYLFEKFKNAN